MSESDTAVRSRIRIHRCKLVLVPDGGGDDPLGKHFVFPFCLATSAGDVNMASATANPTLPGLALARRGELLRALRGPSHAEDGSRASSAQRPRPHPVKNGACRVEMRCGALGPVYFWPFLVSSTICSRAYLIAGVCTWVRGRALKWASLRPATAELFQQFLPASGCRP